MIKLRQNNEETRSWKFNKLQLILYITAKAIIKGYPDPKCIRHRNRSLNKVAFMDIARGT